MHEFSLATAILDLARQHVPAGAVLRAVRVRAGPLRAIDPEDMQWAWTATLDGQPEAGAKIELDLLPWKLTCGDCGRTWQGEDVLAACACGSKNVNADGDDELLLMSIDAEEIP